MKLEVGNRNDGFYHLAMSMKRSGYTKEEAKEACFTINDGLEVKLRESEINGLINIVFKEVNFVPTYIVHKNFNTKKKGPKVMVRRYEAYQTDRNDILFRKIRREVPELDDLANMAETIPLSECGRGFISGMRKTMEKHVGWWRENDGWLASSDAHDIFFFGLYDILINRGANV